ncbi:hypothetical protein GCM10010277_87950 [Streptomyces longisporoflavus]|nr:hypothetical protein GCM10010277_87950 [Streptomyces longisporoflavus]
MSALLLLTSTHTARPKGDSGHQNDEPEGTRNRALVSTAPGRRAATWPSQPEAPSALSSTTSRAGPRGTSLPQGPVVYPDADHITEVHPQTKQQTRGLECSPLLLHQR